MRRIAIIGLGLIGGSMGLALKRARLKETELIGYVRHSETGAKALKMGVVDKVERNLVSTVSQADMVILATPVIAMKEILEQIGAHLSPGCLVTDTASTKVKVMEWAEAYLPPTINFIGGHPMAGKELSGVEVAEASLFEGCTYCLIPGQCASPEAVQSLVELLQKIGANPLFITASEHDNFVAAVSHLPFLLSVALVRATTQSHFWGKMSTLTATGYRDLTRLASQHPRMTRDICLTNQQNILYWMDEFRRELDRLRQLVGDSQKLEEAFIQAQEARQRWLVEKYDKKG